MRLHFRNQGSWPPTSPLIEGRARLRDRAPCHISARVGLSRRRLISQALAEALVLALAGGLAAIVVASWSGRALYGLLLPGIPLPDAAISVRLVGFLGVVVLATTVAAGVLPALAGLALPFALLLAPYAARAVGAGDVKAFMVIGGLWGVSTVLSIMAWSILTAGVVALSDEREGVDSQQGVALDSEQ